MSNTQGLKDIAVGRSDVYRLAPGDLHVKEGWNVRDLDTPAAQTELDELATSIAEVGVKQPLTVYWEDGKAYISDGHRRYYATLKAMERGAEIKSVPVRLEDRHSNEADRVFSMIVRNSGTPLLPIEQARVYKRLIDLGWSEKEIATKAGKSGQYVRNLLELHAAPAEVTEMVRKGEVAASTAVKTLKKNKGNAAKATADLDKAVKTAKAAGKSRATEKHLAEKKPSLKAQLAAVIGRAKIVHEKDDLLGEQYTFTLSPDDYATVRSLLGL